MQELESSQVSAGMDPFYDPKGSLSPWDSHSPFWVHPWAMTRGHRLTLTPTEGAGKLLICPRTVERQEHWNISSQEHGALSCSFCVTKAAWFLPCPLSPTSSATNPGAMGVLAAEEKPLHSSYNLQSRGGPVPLGDGKGAEGIWDFWAQFAPQCHPRTGCLHAFMPSSTGSNVRAGKGSGVATRISKALSIFGMRNQWRGSGLGPWYGGGLQGWYLGCGTW